MDRPDHSTTMKHIFRSLRRRSHQFALRHARQNRFFSSVFYAFFSRRFDREHVGVLQGQQQFSISNGPEGSCSTTLRRNTHRLEKGLIMRPRKDVFALAYIEETIKAYQQSVSHTNGQANEEICWAHDVLKDYFDVCGAHPLIDRLRKTFNSIPPLPLRCAPDRAKAFHPYHRNLKAPASVHYDELLKLAERRRSTRWFKQSPVPRELIEKAVIVAGLSPSACNRQPFEFRFFDAPGLREKVAELPGGTKGFANQFPVIGVVLGNLAHYYDEKDRHVIYIDGSLATMSLILALETLGLGSCCINWPDIEEDEIRAQSVLNLTTYERPIMFLAIGYPDPEGMVPYSAKKSTEQLCRWNYLG
jgi:nitroreductase